uniref:DUF155 domain-containing protein n=1 Tax=Meloidogyne javanica TaxID=6303 RepID=A0A915LQM6_MELJA
LKNCVNSIPLAEGFDLNTLQNNELFTKQFNLNRISHRLNDELEQCIDQLKEGKLIWKASKARQTIGKIASIRHSVNSSELLNKDIYWDLLDIERVYESLAKQLKLASRQRDLNKRIDYCEYFVKTIHEMLDQKHSHRLEWIIIILIFVEILINLPKIMGIFSFESKKEEK